MPNDETPNKVEAKKKRAFKFCLKCGSTDVFWAGYAAVMVAVAVQNMWLPWSIHLGKWQSRLETSGRMEKKGFYQETLTKLDSGLLWLVKYTFTILIIVERAISF